MASNEAHRHDGATIQYFGSGKATRELSEEGGITVEAHKQNGVTIEVHKCGEVTTKSSGSKTAAEKFFEEWNTGTQAGWGYCQGLHEGGGQLGPGQVVEAAGTQDQILPWSPWLPWLP